MQLSGFKFLVGLAAASCLVLNSPVVRAASPQQQSTRGDETQPPPPPGTFRLISIGPQALVREDDQGNLTMVDEAEPTRSRSRVASIMLGAMTAGVLFAFYGDLGPGVVGAPTYRTAGGSNSGR